jgi:hypothetical protein
MQDLVKRARKFATQAHRRIDQRRKYTNQPYDAHLKAVADIVATVSDDPETIASAWLHDTLEDTPATFEDIEAEFGSTIAIMVDELTDVSRPSDGNRAVRKAIDREHLAHAGRNAKTVKLADLIDNCRDIVKHDEAFGRIFVTEASALLEVLEGGEPRLLSRARRIIAKSGEQLGLPPLRPGSLQIEDVLDSGETAQAFAEHRVVRLFADCFRATDIAEPLRSFDSTRDPRDIADVLSGNDLPVAGIRIDGLVMGYARRKDLEMDADSGRLRAFGRDQLIDGDASLSDVIHVLTRHDHCFVIMLGDVVGFVSRSDIQKPIVRMWLFGIVTLMEMEITAQVKSRWPDGDWASLISKGRLTKAVELQQERDRRGVPSALLDCLQLTDKAQILIQDPAALTALGFKTRRAAKKVIREMESLRNHLAHAQDIVTHDWAQIVRLVTRIEEMVSGE